MESPHGDPTTPEVAPARVCVSAPAWADEAHRAVQIGRRQGGQPDTPSRTDRARTSPDLTSHARLPCPTLPTQPRFSPCPPTLPALPRFPSCPRVSYCQRKRHTRIPQNGLLSSHFTISQSIKTLRTDTQQLARQLNIMFII